MTKKTKNKRNVTKIRLPSELPEAMQEALAVFEALRRLGFLSDDIYASFGLADLTMLMTLRTPTRDASIRVGKLPKMTRKQFVKLWTIACEGANGKFPQSSLDDLWQKSSVYQNSGRLVMSLVTAGISIPAARKAMN